ncbi:MAG: 20S proteasome subunit A/B [Xanthomonadales bacterium]|nr:20S proteasome subunit A/B [Xanthomonadales bacterium]
MTYCVAIQVDQGLVFAADTRTSASFDDIRVHAKLHVFDFPGERCFVLMTSGNLGTTQAVVARLRRDLEDGVTPNLRSVADLNAAADYVGQLLVAAQAQIAASAQSEGVKVGATLILGGVVAGDPPGILLVYSLGNWIAASPETPYLQIGESKYGKPILDRIIRPHTTLEDAARCALVSIDSTIRSNVSVGLPIDLAILRAGEARIGERMRLDADTPLYAEIHDTWSRKLEAAVRSLPRFPWEPATAGAPLQQAAKTPTPADAQGAQQQ